MRTRIVRGAAVAALFLTAAALTACGDDTTSAAGSPSQTQTASNGDVFDDADVRFATDMIQHHAQAIEMVTLTDGRDLDPQLAQLANEIRDAQSPEVEQMVDWLTAWDQEIPATSLDHANADHGTDDMEDMDGGSSGTSGMPGMPGMMSADEMDALAGASGADFERRWLEMMTAHHRGAVEMARAEQESGVNGDALALADSIIETQQAEISTMERLLG